MNWNRSSLHSGAPAEPGFARREPHREYSSVSRGRRRHTGEPWVPPCLRHGFRFVVFVNRRPRRVILEVLRERIHRPTDEELSTGLDELVAIAIDRWRLE
jgi:OHCU decarboxylase